MAAKRILVFGMTENPGGVESFLRNYYTHMDRESIQFDFLCNSYNPIAYEEEFIALGAKTIHFPPRHSHPIGFRRHLTAFFKAHANEYEAIWVNVNSLANIDYLKMAKRYGIRRLIIHGHNSQNMDSGMVGRIRGVLHRRNKKVIENYATDFWACAECAADYFYGDGELRERAMVIHNAVEVDRLIYRAEARKKYRDQIGAGENTKVIGNVGRLHFQKNQHFLLDWFADYLKYNEDARLVLVGAGEDEKALREHATNLGIMPKVYWAGLSNDVPGYMSAFDCFAFPSVFEGVSLVGLEAQANGLPVVASVGAVPQEAILFSDRVHRLSLDEPLSTWSKKLDRVLREQGRSTDANEIAATFRAYGYDINEETPKLVARLLGEEVPN